MSPVLGDDQSIDQDGRPASKQYGGGGCFAAVDVAGKWTSKGNYMVGCRSNRYSYSVIIAFSNRWSLSFFLRPIRVDELRGSNGIGVIVYALNHLNHIFRAK